MDAVPTRASLLLRIRDAEDGESWGEFVELYGPMVYRYLKGRGLQAADAEDVSQEVLTAVAKAIREFEYDPEKGKFRGWLFQVVRNRVQYFFRKTQKQPKGTGRTTVQAFLEDQTLEEDESVWDKEYKRQVFHWAVDKVKPTVNEATWSAFWKTAVDGDKPDDVANELGMNPGTVYVAKSRVIAKMREAVLAVTDSWDPNLDVI